MAFSKSPTPLRGKRDPLTNCVKVSTYSGSQQFLVRVSPDLAEELGWVPGKRVAFFVGTDDDAGWIALETTDHPDSTSVLSPGKGGRSPHIYITKSRVEAAAKLPTGTSEADFYVHDGALFVRIPQVEQRPANPFHRKRGVTPRNRPNGLATEVRA